MDARFVTIAEDMEKSHLNIGANEGLYTLLGQIFKLE